MQKHSTFIDNSQSRENISQLIENIKETHTKLGDICFLYDQLDGIKLSETDTYQFFISYLTPKNAFEKVFFSLILRTMYQLETRSGNSAHFVFSYALNLLQQLLKNNDVFSKQQESSLAKDLESYWIEHLKPILEECTNIPTEEIIKNSIDASCHNKKDLACALYEAVMLSGLEGKIFVEDGKQTNYIVELKSGYAFKAVEPYKFLLDNQTHWNRNQVKVMVIDGMIEEVSEIDTILNKANETKQPLLIIASAFGEEVAATCKINNDKGNIDVQLLRFTQDVWSLNVANDIAIVCGTTPISSLQGNVISMTDWNELPTVDRVQITLNQTNIENSKTQQSVLMHMKTILEKKKTANSLVEDIQNIYDSRLKSLASNAVYLYLPNGTEVENKTLRITIDNILRNIKTLMQFGIIDSNKIQKRLFELLTSYKSVDNNYFNKVLTRTLYDFFANSTQKEMPLLTVALGFLLITKLCFSLISTGGFVISDQ